MKHLPNIITLVNLFAGCLAAAYAFGHDPASASLLIIVCSLLDFLDGTLARLLNAGSEIGKQLDSMADLISFGLAPAAIMYYYLTSSPDLPGNGLAAMIPLVAFLIAVFSALRLARFNLDPQQKDHFIGLPTPANALFFAAIPLVTTWSTKQGFVYAMLIDLIGNTIAMTITILLFSALLVVPIRMFSLKFKNFNLKENAMRYIFAGITIAVLILLGWESIPLIILLYILLSVLSGLSPIRKLVFSN